MAFSRTDGAPSREVGGWILCAPGLTSLIRPMELLEPSVLLGRASEIADTLLATAATNDDLSITWHRGFNVRRTPSPDAGIYNGRAGEALFFAALGSATGNNRYLNAARAAIAGVRRAFARPSGVAAMAREYGLGLAGVGSHLYALETIGRLLDDVDIRACARSGVDGLTSELIWADQKLELFWGASGLLLGLLAVADARHDRALALAAQCGRKLVADRTVDDDTGFRAWMSYHGKPASGFAHGTSGIALSLIELHRRVPDPRLLDAVTEAFSFERTLRDPTSGNWFDIKGVKDWQCSWCHGAPGIGFARVAAAHCLGNSTPSEIIDDLFVILHRVAAYPGDMHENLCCGALGRADFLLEAGLRLENEALIGHSHRMVAEVLRRRSGAEFWIPGDREAHLMPGMWQGLGGIGYQLVRMTDPHRFGSVLNQWSTPEMASKVLVRAVAREPA